MRIIKSRIIKPSKGFSLIEMIVVMVVTALVFFIGSNIITTAFKNYFIAVSATNLSTQANLAMMRMSQELQQASSFSSIGSSSVSFTTFGGSSISYSYSGTTLSRTGSSTQTLATSVSSFSLSYYQSNFTTTSMGSLVKAVTISLTLNSGTESVGLINTVFLPNMI